MKIFLLSAALFACLSLKAQFPYQETFKNATSPGLVVSGSAKLTAAAGIDVAGDGYLRLTDITPNNVGYMYAQNSFPSQYGITASFEFFSWKPGANSTNQADGMTFFLFDASVNAFRPGGTGGSLGYAQYYAVPGMAKGYIGISIDPFGNFSSASDGNKNGGPGQQRNSVAIRGPGNGKSTTDYVYQTGVIASDPLYNASFQAFTQRYPDSINANYRRIKIIMTPGSTAGASIGYKITILMYKGGATVTPVTLINNFDYPFPAPAKLQFGLSGSTGSITNYHEVRNLYIDATNITGLLAPTVTSDLGSSACQGQQSIIDVTANDVCNNTGGAINKSTVDLDPATPGRQTSFTDAGKGTYNVDNNGIVSFTPQAGYSGTSTINYLVDDTYGKTATVPATITVTVSNSLGPALVTIDAPAVCAPVTVDLTNPALKTVTAVGASFSYFATLSDANNNTAAINATASTINQSGTYYVRESLSGCATIKPITVQIHTVPTVSNAGSDQTLCGSTAVQSSTLLANNPDVGAGAWTQVSGTSTATITYPNAATSPVSNLAQGVHVFRWTVSNGACPASMDDIQVSVGTGIPANAGSNQTIANAASVTLSGNAPAPGTGVWSKITGPAVSFANTANPSTGIMGLTPGNNYVLQWKITNGICVSTSQVTIVNVLNTIANAGLDRTETALLPFALAGNAPDAGNTGTWTIISKPTGALPSIALPNSPTATVSGISLYGNYIFRWTMTNGTFSNYADVTVRVASVLPVKLVSFSGAEMAGSVRLTWKALSEQNNDHFELERSDDAAAYKSIAMVASKSSTGSVYNYDDGDVRNNTVIYYRLKMIDKDGHGTYSPVVKVMLGKRPELVTATNPFSSQILAQVYLLQGGSVQLRLYDNNGRMVRQQTQNVSSGANGLFLTQLSALPQGLYHLEVEGSQLHKRLTVLKED